MKQAPLLKMRVLKLSGELIRMFLSYGMKRMIVGQQGRCLLYTSDAADDLLCVDLGGRRIGWGSKYRSKCRDNR